MAKFDEHVKQATSNLSLLHHTNKSKNDAWDWQVTMCFYTAVHLVNAHIAHKQDLHYRSHKQVKHALNPAKSIPIGTELTEELYKSYVKLQNLSRRSRYLCLDSEDVPESDVAYLTFDKHLAKAIYHLDRLMDFINKEYSVKFHSMNIDCKEMEKKTYSHFKYHKYATSAGVTV